MQLSIEIHSDRRWSYANAGTRRPLVKAIVLAQDGALPDRDINILPRVALDFPLPEVVAPVWSPSVHRTLESRGGNVGSSFEWDKIDLDLNYPLLGRLQEKVRGLIRAEIVDIDSGEILATATQALELLAPNEFRQEADYLEVIAAFVLPNDPFVSEILTTARELLNERTGDSATQGYQADGGWSPHDPDFTLDGMRSHKIANAIYDAMSAVGYDYSNPQGYFEEGAQRVRTPSQIRRENCATCLDSAVLMGACFAQAGLEPVIFMIHGHAFAGYFTGRPFTVGNKTYSGEEAVRVWLRVIHQTGQAQLLRVRDHGLIQELLHGRHVVPVETTTTTRSSPLSFRDACQRQNNFSVDTDPLGGVDDSTLEGIVCVSLAWRDGITPPVVIDDANSAKTGQQPGESMTGKTFVGLDLDGSDEGEVTIDDRTLSEAERAIPPRIRQWMASLLDLSSRNPLLKIKPAQAMEFDVPPSIIASLDDTLFTPKKRVKLAGFSSLPYSWVHDGVSDDAFEQWSRREASLVYPSYKELNEIQRLIEREIRSVRNSPDHPFHSMNLTEAVMVQMIREHQLSVFDGTLARAAKKLVDKANDVMLMTGNNSLYLALGTMAWSENTNFLSQGKSIDWCAPLYLYPVILEGGKGRPWTLRLDSNGEVTPNFCLHEKLKRPPYNIDLQELVNPDADEAGIDLDKMVRDIRVRLRQAKLDHIAIQPRAVLGVFDYATFRLWKDLRDDWQKMAQVSPVFDHIARTSNVPFLRNPPVPTTRLEPLLPIAADDSQRDAVQMALDGQSFKLEGPPGTGKSQTITNLLASCIAHNLKVLFVAEKQTALNAVKSRLDAAGLGAFSLNLHAKGDSDAKLRKNISTALTNALSANIDPGDQEWRDIEFKLNKEQRLLDQYRESLHTPGEDGFTTWAVNEQLLELGEGPGVDLPPDFVARFEEVWKVVQDVSMDLELALDLVPEPKRHPWRFAGSIDLNSVDFEALGRALTALAAATTGTAPEAVQRSDLHAVIGTSTMAFIRTAMDLARQGLLPDLTDRGAETRLDQSTLESFRGRVRSFFDEAESLLEALAPHEVVVDPSLLERQDHEHLLYLIQAAESADLQRELETEERSWAQIAHRSRELPSSAAFRPLTPTEITRARQLLDSVQNSSDQSEYERLIQSLRGLQGRIGEYAGSITSDFISRNDLADIEFRWKEATEAGALKRKGKIKAFREALGPQALTDDDRLLLHAASQMIGLAREWRAGVDDLRIRFPEVTFEEADLSSTQAVTRMAGALRQTRVQMLRQAGFLDDGPSDDWDFVNAIRTVLELSPLVDEARQRALHIMPTAPVDSLQPWVASSFDRFRHQVLDERLQSFIRVLGVDARSTDPEALVRATRATIALKEDFESLRRRFQVELFPAFTAEIKPWRRAELDRIRGRLNEVEAHLGEGSDSDLAVLQICLSDPTVPSLGNLLSNAAEAWETFTQVVPIADVDAWLEGRPLLVALAEEVPELLRDAGLNNNFLEFQRWQTLRAAIDRVESLGLWQLTPAILDRTLEPNEFLTYVRRSALTHALRTRMEAGNLDRFDRKVHERRIAAFEAALAEARTLLQRRIPGLAASRRAMRRLPSGEQGGATQALLKELKPKKGDKTPLRHLLSRYGNALAAAMPCFLMSPDSVAALLPVGSIDFDLVVFDEASQIRTSHAVGALGRGRAAIVVGDSRQMPPSSTFSSNSGTFVDNDDEDASGIDNSGDGLSDEAAELLAAVAARDAESILTEFEEAALPQRQLLCHYRSKDEVLISFSNSFIYDEPMLTFPSTMGLQSTALRYVHVTEGHFERDRRARPYQLGDGVPPVPALRTNWREAELIVGEIISRLTDPVRSRRRSADPSGMAESMIVVTFNIQQMNLITELLRNRVPDLFEQTTTAQVLEDESETTIPPQLKIRNLENVQGDEAETVIFSVAFSKTREGKFPLRFGPVTQTGGERRLNVAVTRAQREMIVYASFLPDDMGAGGANLSHEARLLQQFLKLAYKGAAASGDVGIAVPRSRHIEDVARELRDLGFEVQPQLGLSSLRVDLALKRPGAPEWEIAVMVDDTCWAQRGSAFQRELLPQQILPAMGWKRVYRIWLPAWKNSKDEILAELGRYLTDPDIWSEKPPSVDVDDAGGTPVPTTPTRSGSQDSESQPEQQPPQSATQSAALTPTVEPAMTNPQGQVESTLRGSGFTVFTPYREELVGSLEVLNTVATRDASEERVRAVIEKVLLTEAPIASDRLGKIVCRAFALKAVTDSRIAQVIGLVDEKRINRDEIGRFVWCQPGEWDVWTGYRTSIGEALRPVDHIPWIEYRNALVDFVDRSHSLPHEEAVKELATAFGFQRVSKQIRDTIEKAIALAVKAGNVQQSDDVYTVRSPRP